MYQVVDSFVLLTMVGGVSNLLKMLASSMSVIIIYTSIMFESIIISGKFIIFLEKIRKILKLKCVPNNPNHSFKQKC